MEKEYKKIATSARIKVLEMIFRAQTSHISSNFSCIDIAAVLYENADLKHDKIIWSKGWAAATAYYFLWEKGKITEEELNSYCQPDSKFIGLVEPMSRVVKCNCYAEERIQVGQEAKRKKKPAI